MAHLALFVSSLPRGAIQDGMLTLARRFAEAGHRVTLLAARVDGPPRGELPDAVRVVDLGVAAARAPIVGGRKRWWVPRAERPLARWLARERPDALLSGGEYANLTGLRAAARAGVTTRVVPSEHIALSRGAGGGVWRRKWLLRWALRRRRERAHRWIAASEGVARDLVDFVAIDPARVVAIANPVLTPALEAASEEPLDDSWLRPGEPPVIACVAALRQQKDHATLLRAFAQLRSERALRLLLLGEGPRRSALERLAGRLGVADDVRFAGWVENPLPVLRRAAVLAQASRYEGFGNALVEALACGCPVVATDCPCGPAEILEGGRYGRLVPVGDATALASAIATTLDAPPDAEKLRLAAARYRDDLIARRYLEVLLG